MGGGGGGGGGRGGGSPEQAAVARIQTAIDRSAAGSADRAAAVGEMKGVQKIFKARNKAGG